MTYMPQNAIFACGHPFIIAGTSRANGGGGQKCRLLKSGQARRGRRTGSI